MAQNNLGGHVVGAPGSGRCGRRGARCSGGGRGHRAGRGARSRGAIGTCAAGGSRASLGLGHCGTVAGGASVWLATPKIGNVPTASLELETGGCHLFFKCGLGATGAIAQWRVGDFLQNVLGKSASAALVGVNRHSKKPLAGGWAKPVIIVCLVPEKPSCQGQRQQNA